MLADAPLSPLRAWAISPSRIVAMSHLQDLDLRSHSAALDQRGPIAEDLAHRWAAFGVSRNALRAAGDERGELAGETLDDVVALIINTDAQHDFTRVGVTSCRTGDDFACAEAFDARARGAEAGLLQPGQDDLAAAPGLGDGVAAEDRQHSGGAIAGAVGGADLVGFWRGPA